MIAINPISINRDVFVPLFKKIHGGFRFYCILGVTKTNKGIVSKMFLLNPFGEDMISEKKDKYFILGFPDQEGTKRIGVFVSRFADPENKGVWLAQLKLTF